MKSKSRYYELASPVEGREREWALRYWGDPRLEDLTLVRPLGFIPEWWRVLAVDRFNAAVDQFGTCYDAGSLVYLTSSIHKTDYDYARADCQASWFPSAGVHHPHLSDHSTYFRRDGRVTAVVWQPYSASTHDINVLSEFCAEIGLQLEASEQRAWHFMGTTALIFTRSEQPTYQGHWLN